MGGVIGDYSECRFPLPACHLTHAALTLGVYTLRAEPLPNDVPKLLTPGVGGPRPELFDICPRPNAKTSRSEEQVAFASPKTGIYSRYLVVRND